VPGHCSLSPPRTLADPRCPRSSRHPRAGRGAGGRQGRAGVLRAGPGWGPARDQAVSPRQSSASWAV